MNAMSSADQKILSLTDDDMGRLIKHRSLIEKYLGNEDSREKYNTAPGKLGTLRALLNANVFKADQTYELQSMGVVFGDVFVQDMGFHWIIVEDTYGRDPAIQYKDTSIILYPLTTISKRVEKGEKVDVFELYNGMAAKVEELMNEGR